MKVFIVGAAGYAGVSLVEELARHGATLSGLARSEVAADKLRSLGVAPIAGDAEDSGLLADCAARADAVVFSANIPFDREAAVMAPLFDRLAGSGKPFIFTSGTAVLSIETLQGEWREESFAEGDLFTPIPRMQTRVATEALVRAQAERGIRAMVIRPPLIWGRGGSKQVPAMFRSVVQTGAACYVGRGLNCYSNVNVDDLAALYGLALKKGVAGGLYHAVGGEVGFRAIAEAVAQATGAGTRSVTMEEACEIWSTREGPMYFGVSSRSRSPRSHSELGWRPQQFDLIDDIRNGSYRNALR